MKEKSNLYTPLSTYRLGQAIMGVASLSDETKVGVSSTWKVLEPLTLKASDIHITRF
jgi:hypothetical protein